MKRSVTVQIAGQRYSLRSDSDDRAVQQLAAYVDAKFREVQKHVKTPDTQMVAILTALRIAEELHEARRAGVDLKKRIREKSRSILDCLEREAGV